MNVSLIRKLIEVGIVRQDTEVTAPYKSVDMAGSATVESTGTYFLKNVSVNENSDSVILETISTVNGTKRKLKFADVILIDGMEVSRLAATYGINTKGLKMTVGKKRGRKPKNRAQENG